MDIAAEIVSSFKSTIYWGVVMLELKKVLNTLAVSLFAVFYTMIKQITDTFTPVLIIFFCVWTVA